jgi:thymidylate synthase
MAEDWKTLKELQRHTIIADSVALAYSELLRSLLANGEECRPRGMRVLEIRPLMVRITGRERWPTQPTRKLSKALGVLEGLQLIGGFSVPAALVAVAPQYAKFVNPATGLLDGSYGPRLAVQTNYLRRLLRQDGDSRQAVAVIYGEQDHRTSLDVPCTVSLQFLARRGELELVATMRSNDAWLGFPYDVVQFSLLQEALAADLKLQVGSYTHVVGSMHLYQRNAEAAAAVADDDASGPARVPALVEQPFEASAIEAHSAVALWMAENMNGLLWDAENFTPFYANEPASPFFKWCLATLRDFSRRAGDD